MGPRLLRALLHRAADAPPDSDAELLARFVATRDEPAFAELVRRYGGLVWGQCRNLLLNEADAEDAFQATFLVLARRPDAVRSAVGPYLHGVAYRVCLNARRLAGRRKKREVASATSEVERPVADSAWDAALATVHEELHRLPDPQREAFVLCVLEGRGLTDAAEHLGVKLGTLSARLSRAKQTIMDRLTAKGVVAGIAAVTALAPAGVAAAVAANAVHSAVGSAVIPESALALTHGVTRMVTSKLKLLAAGVLLACGVGLSVGPGLVATAQDKQKPAPPGKPADTRTQELEREVEALKATLLKSQAELAKPPVAAAPEFKYVPLTGDGAMSAKDFEKVVAENEKGGYTLVGSVPLTGKKFLNKIEEEAILTLVFRKKAEPPKPVVAAPAPKPEKLYAVRFDSAPWPKVAEWLAKENGLTLLGNVAPQGTCTIKFDRQVTIGELMDTFNEVLAQQKLTLVRGEQTLRFWPADKPLPQLYIRPVRVEDLDRFGKSEVVQVVLPLDGISAEDAEKLAKKLKSQFGEVTTIAEKQLVIRDRAGEVRAVIAALQARVKQPAQPVRIALKNGNAVGAAVRAAAAVRYADRPTALKVEVNWNVVKLTGDDDAVKWAAKLVDELTK